MPTPSVYDFSARRLGGREEPLGRYRGEVLLVVNVASRCGFTPQYAGLQSLYEQYRGRGFEILAFPCNQFARQEPGSAGEIEAFCSGHYGVSFPLFEKIRVNGVGAHPLYRHLRKAAPGILGSRAIKWNFTKFLVDREGRVVSRFASRDEPHTLKGGIEALL